MQEEEKQREQNSDMEVERKVKKQTAAVKASRLPRPVVVQVSAGYQRRRKGDGCVRQPMLPSSDHRDAAIIAALLPNARRSSSRAQAHHLGQS